MVKVITTKGSDLLWRLVLLCFAVNGLYGKWTAFIISLFMSADHLKHFTAHVNLYPVTHMVFIHIGLIH